MACGMESQGEGVEGVTGEKKGISVIFSTIKNVMVKTVDTEVRLTTGVQILILSLLNRVTFKTPNLSFNLICITGIFATSIS